MRSLRMAGMFLLAYVAIVVLLLIFENFFVFHPISADADWDSPPDRRVVDVQIQGSGGEKVHGWWYPTPNWQPADGAMLYCHGNAGNLSHRAPLITRWQQELNQAVLIIDYPGYGKSEGKPSEAGCYDTADRMYDWLVNTQMVPGEKIVLYGKSLGGAVAVDLAARRPHRALVLHSTFTSVPDMAQQMFPWLPGRWLVRNQFNSIAKITKCPRPIFISHGTADTLIRISHGERLFAAAPEPKVFFPIEGMEHNSHLGANYYAALRSFFGSVQ